MRIAALYIDAQVADWPETRSICSRFEVPTQTVATADEVYADLAAAEDPVGRGKQVLYLTRNKGAFIKPCPGTSHYTCCGYKILHVGTFCTMDCAYCILQSYFHPPVLQYFLNQADLNDELEQLFGTRTVHRLGTGEFTDSLIWEPWTGLSEGLIRKFAGQDCCVLELKTKTTFIDTLLALPHRRRTILAWSLNTERVIGSEERGTASLDARLRAAARCAAQGYPLAFHFDPIVIDDGCEAEYRRTVDRLFALIDSRHIVWISLGALRFMPDLKPIVQRRFPRLENRLWGMCHRAGRQGALFQAAADEGVPRDRAGHPCPCAGCLPLFLHGGRRGLAGCAGIHSWSTGRPRPDAG